MYLRIFILLFILFNSHFCCKIELKIKSATKQPFEIEIDIPSLKKHTERLLIEKNGVQKKTMVQGQNCGDKPWIIKTYRQNSNGEFQKAQQHKARFDGDGEITILIMDDLIPRVISRDGVACSETLICG